MANAPYIIGVDLGQASDFTALAVLKRSPALDADGKEVRSPRGDALHSYVCNFLRRYPLGTPYPKIIEHVGDLVRRPELAGRVTLVADATGVGRAVIDLFLAARLPVRFHPLMITGGDASRSEPWGGALGYWTPKRHLVGAVQVLLQTEMLKIVPALELAETLRRELMNFKVKVTAAANETFGSWREADHDDLVLALAMATWLPVAEPGCVRIGPSRPPHPPNLPPGLMPPGYGYGHPGMPRPGGYPGAPPQYPQHPQLGTQPRPLPPARTPPGMPPGGQYPPGPRPPGMPGSSNW